MDKILYKPKDLENKKVVKVEAMRAEFGRTYDTYLCFTCEDDTRVMLHGGEPYNANTDVDEMRKISFFTPEEIGEKLTQIEKRKRQREQETKDQMKRQFELLKRQLGEE